MSKKQDTIQNTDICYIKDDIAEIKKSIKIINDHSEEITKMATDMEWIKRFFWIIITATIGSLITSLFNLLIK